jgi:Predicted metal-dependent membrane protease
MREQTKGHIVKLAKKAPASAKTRKRKWQTIVDDCLLLLLPGLAFAIFHINRLILSVLGVGESSQGISAAIAGTLLSPIFCIALSLLAVLAIDWRVFKRKWSQRALYPLLIIASYLLSSVTLSILCNIVFGDQLVSIQTNPIFGMAYTVAVFLLMLIVAICVPWLIGKVSTSLREVGLIGLPTWTDVLLAPVGYIVSSIIGAVILYGVAAVVSGVDPAQQQDLIFDANGLITSSDYMLAFLTLTVLTPLVEEVLFRGFLYGKLRPHLNMWLASFVVSFIFGVLHGQWNVGLLVFAMSFTMCLIREKLTGTIWACVLIHMVRNGIAFYLLYVNPVSKMLGV